MRYQYLEWDTQFFSKIIGRIDLDNKDSFKDLKDLIAEKREIGVELIYLFTPIDYILPSNALFKKVDTRVIYQKDLKNYSRYLNLDSVHLYKGQITSDIYDLSLVSGQYSRFNVDESISQSDFVRLYNARIDKSYKEKALYVNISNSQIDGIVTIDYNGNDEAAIGLIATRPSEQGKGIGRKMLQKVFLELISKDIFKLTIATQEPNIQARKFYESCGMQQVLVFNIYHCWL